VAGIAGLALAWRHFTKDAREAEAQAKKTREEVKRIIETKAGPTGTLLGAIGITAEDLSRAQADRAARAASLRPRFTTPGPGGRAMRLPDRTDAEIAADAELQKLDTEIALLERNLGLLQRELARERAERTEGVGKERLKEHDDEIKALLEGQKLRTLTREETLRLLQLERQLTEELRTQTDLARRNVLAGQLSGVRAAVRTELGVPAVPADSFQGAGLRFRTPERVGQREGTVRGRGVSSETDAILNRVIGGQLRYNQTLEELQGLLRNGSITEEQYNAAKDEAARAANRAGAATRSLARETERFAISAINTVAAIASMAVSGQGSAGGFLGLAGGLVSFINPLAGAGIGALGAIVSAVERRNEPQPVSRPRAAHPRSRSW
jgi:hypothetical protein